MCAEIQNNTLNLSALYLKYWAFSHYKNSSAVRQKNVHQLDRMDAKLQRLLTDLQAYSEAELNRKPSPESWSVLQILHHLMLAERLSVGYVRKKLSFNPTLPNTGLLTWLRLQGLRTYNWLPVKLKAPKAVGKENLPDESTLADAAQQWLAQRAELRTWLSALPEELFKKELYKHPLAGRQSLYGMLLFFEGHFDRHLQQIQRSLRP